MLKASFLLQGMLLAAPKARLVAAQGVYQLGKPEILIVRSSYGFRDDAADERDEE